MTHNKLFNLLMRRKNPQEIMIALLLIIIFAIFIKNSIETISPSPNQVIEGKVIKIIDGDTIDVLDNQNIEHRIRLYGIDAPESKQAYGQQSKAFLASLIAGKNIKIIIKDKDRYQRNIGKILLGDKDINKEMVINGYAHAYREYSDEYIVQEVDAKASKLGLWKDEYPIKPSDFRRLNK